MRPSRRIKAAQARCYVPLTPQVRRAKALARAMERAFVTPNLSHDAEEWPLEGEPIILMSR